MEKTIKLTKSQGKAIEPIIKGFYRIVLKPIKLFSCMKFTYQKKEYVIGRIK